MCILEAFVQSVLEVVYCCRRNTFLSQVIPFSDCAVEEGELVDIDSAVLSLVLQLVASSCACAL